MPSKINPSENLKISSQKKIHLYNNFKNLDLENLSECSFVNGDSLDILKTWGRKNKNYFQCVVTSPPYWGLRDYNYEKNKRKLGSEAIPETYIKRLVKIFNAMKNVLSDDGIFWLNIGDSYTSGNRKWRDADSKNKHRAMTYRPGNPPGLKNKELIGLPWQLARALQFDDWFLRAEIIWNKPNAQPESVKDRPTRSHEVLFMFTKKERYYYDYNYAKSINGRNLRTVWDINTKPIMGDHPATYPVSLASRCILLSTKPGQFVLDPFVGSGTTCIAAHKSKRKSVGLDIKKSYLNLALKRMKDAIAKK